MQMHNGTIVAVADGAKLVVYCNEGTRNHPDLKVILHAGRKAPPSRDAASDSPGRFHSSIGERRSSYEETDWHDQAEDKFVLQSAELIESVLPTGADAEMIVIAPSRALGELRKYYGPLARQRIVAEIDKDLVRHPPNDIVKTVASYERPSA